jgi:uncharacterized surface protein with fasciclin (FAS1) repeats|tara:strand:+ start:1028 stop:1633 length:606 start_codon:yes stop_codon:yes gene_type:complete
MKLLKVLGIVMFFSMSIANAGHHEEDNSYMMSALEATGQHNILISAIKAAGLEKLFSEQSKVPRTLYAPNDEAFKKLPKALSDELFVKNNKKAVRKLLFNHVFAGSHSGENVKSEGTLTVNLDGKILKIYKEGDLYVKDMVITEKDIAVKNGIIHSIECVMFVQPSDTDSRLDLETQNKFSLTSCCMRTDLEVNSFLGDVK